MHHIVIQHAVPRKIPGAASLKRWANAALQHKIPAAEITIRVVNTREMTKLNSTYRKKTGPTNVLAFPFEMPDMLEDNRVILGDIVICSAVVNKEAKEQKKDPKAHWAHMVIHGTLHLLGYDHVKLKDAKVMEAEEIRILQTLKIANPYQLPEEKVTTHAGRPRRR